MKYLVANQFMNFDYESRKQFRKKGLKIKKGIFEYICFKKNVSYNDVLARKQLLDNEETHYVSVLKICNTKEEALEEIKKYSSKGTYYDKNDITLEEYFIVSYNENNININQDTTLNELLEKKIGIEYVTDVYFGVTEYSPHKPIITFDTLEDCENFKTTLEKIDEDIDLDIVITSQKSENHFKSIDIETITKEQYEKWFKN